MKKQCPSYDGKEPIKVLQFLREFAMMCNYHQYSEGTAVWLFQDFLKGDALALVNKRTGAQGRDIESRSLKEQLPTCLLYTSPSPRDA